MPLCEKCRKFYPPQFCNQMEENEFLCEWCHRDIESILVTRSDGSQYKYTKEECAKDYDIFIKKLKESKDIKKIVKGERQVAKKGNKDMAIKSSKVKSR